MVSGSGWSAWLNAVAGISCFPTPRLVNPTSGGCRTRDRSVHPQMWGRRHPAPGRKIGSDFRRFFRPSWLRLRSIACSLPPSMDAIILGSRSSAKYVLGNNPAFLHLIHRSIRENIRYQAPGGDRMPTLVDCLASTARRTLLVIGKLRQAGLHPHAPRVLEKKTTGRSCDRLCP